MINFRARFEFGFVAGAGVDIGRRLTIDGRYSRGLTPLNTDRVVMPRFSGGS
jgi:hypothetical protein